MATLYDSLDSDDEEEEERILSEQHGEADATDRKRKDAPDMDYSGDVKPPKRAARPKVTIELLTGMNGLIRIPTEFKTRSIPRDCKSAATYTSTLIKLYTTFCSELLPHHAVADVQLQIEKLGAKKEIKAYLQNMRDAARNRHVEHLLGREKAEKLLQELELGLRQQDEYAPDDDHFVNQRELEAHMTASELENNTRENDERSPVAPTLKEARNTLTAVSNRSGRKSIYDDSSDEEEAVFDEPSIVVTPVEKVKRAEEDEEKTLEIPVGIDSSTESLDNIQQNSMDTQSDKTHESEAPTEQHDAEGCNKTDEFDIEATDEIVLPCTSQQENVPDESTPLSFAKENQKSDLDEPDHDQAESGDALSFHERASDSQPTVDDAPISDSQELDTKADQESCTEKMVLQEQEHDAVNTFCGDDANKGLTDESVNEEPSERVSFQVTTEQSSEDISFQVEFEEPNEALSFQVECVETSNDEAAFQVAMEEPISTQGDATMEQANDNFAFQVAMEVAHSTKGNDSVADAIMEDAHEDVSFQVAMEEVPLTQANDPVANTISFAQPTQDVHDSQLSETSTMVDYQPTQLSEAPTIVANTQSMDFETQLSQMHD